MSGKRRGGAAARWWPFELRLGAVSGSPCTANAGTAHGIRYGAPPGPPLARVSFSGRLCEVAPGVCRLALTSGLGRIARLWRLFCPDLAGCRSTEAGFACSAGSRSLPRALNSIMPPNWLAEGTSTGERASVVLTEDWQKSTWAPPPTTAGRLSSAIPPARGARVPGDLRRLLAAPQVL